MPDTVELVNGYIYFPDIPLFHFCLHMTVLIQEPEIDL